MAKYCANCGRLFPEGVEVCPDCHVEGQEDEAALFTKITAETEVWQADDAPREKRRLGWSRARWYVYTIAAVVVILAAVFIIRALQPRSRVIRALDAGNYDQALELYWADEDLSAGEGDTRVQTDALRVAWDVLDRYKNREISAEAASEALGKLGTFGARSEAMLADTYDEFRALLASRERFDAGEALFAQGDYLSAREAYLLVEEGDPDYAAARARAEDCVGAYVDDVLAEANVLIQSGDYAGAIDALKAGDRALLALTLYSEKIDYKLNACYALYEGRVLTEAERLAALRDYASAAALIEQSMTRYEFETDALNEALEGYRLQARDKTVEDAAARADVLYAQGDYAGAFSALDSLWTAPDAIDVSALDAATGALEHRFANDRIYDAKVLYDNTRENLDEAIALLNAALRVRQLPELSIYKDELSQYLPAPLSELRYVEKEGIIFRSASVFEGLDGVDYEDGWVWGADGASLTFVLDGAYDKLTGTFAVRREDKTRAGGYFEVWCDGEQVYKSEALQHRGGTSLPVEVDLSGCNELVLRFYNDYNVSTSEDGYCYHGLCDGFLTKDIPEAEEENG